MQWVACLTCNVEVVGSSPIKGPRCFLEQETLPLLLSTGWFQERISQSNQNKLRTLWKITCQISLLVKYHQNQNQISLENFRVFTLPAALPN